MSSSVVYDATWYWRRSRRRDGGTARLADWQTGRKYGVKADEFQRVNPGCPAGGYFRLDGSVAPWKATRETGDGALVDELGT